MSRFLALLMILVLGPSQAFAEGTSFHWKPAAKGDTVRVVGSSTMDRVFTIHRDGKLLKRGNEVGRHSMEFAVTTLAVKDGVPARILVRITKVVDRSKEGDQEEVPDEMAEALTGTAYLLFLQGKKIRVTTEKAVPVPTKKAEKLRKYFNEYLGELAKGYLPAFPKRPIQEGETIKIPSEFARKFYVNSKGIKSIKLKLTFQGIQEIGGRRLAVFMEAGSIVDQREKPLTITQKTQARIYMDPATGWIYEERGGGKSTVEGSEKTAMASVIIVGAASGKKKIRSSYGRVKDLPALEAELKKKAEAYAAKPKLNFTYKPLKSGNQTESRRVVLASGTTTVKVDGVLVNTVKYKTQGRSRTITDLNDITDGAATDLKVLIKELMKITDNGVTGPVSQNSPLEGRTILATSEAGKLSMKYADGTDLSPQAIAVVKAKGLVTLGDVMAKTKFLSERPYARGEEITPPMDYARSVLADGSMQPTAMTMKLLDKETYRGVECAVFEVSGKSRGSMGPQGGVIAMNLTGKIWVGLGDSLTRKADLSGTMSVRPPDQKRGEKTLKIFGSGPISIVLEVTVSRAKKPAATEGGY